MKKKDQVIMKTIIVSFEILQKASCDLSKNWNLVILCSFISVDQVEIYTILDLKV